ncbi:ATP-binding protein [Pelagicoccus sp. SDUM812003]|nr:ATP-binding protein [Pelagicoccus sp. SDUM812003]
MRHALKTELEETHHIRCDSTPSDKVQLACLWTESRHPPSLYREGVDCIVLGESIPFTEISAYIEMGALGVYDLRLVPIKVAAELIKSHLRSPRKKAPQTTTPSSRFAILEWDRDFRIARWSDDAETLTGLSRNQALNRSIGEWLIPEEEIGPFIASCHSVIKGELPEFKGQWNIITADEQTLPTFWKVVPKDHRAQSFIGIFELASSAELSPRATPLSPHTGPDATPPVHDELPDLLTEAFAQDSKVEFLATAVEHLAIGVYVTDETEDCVFTVWNKEMQRLFQKKKSEVLGKRLSEVFTDPLLRSVLSEVAPPRTRNRAIIPQMATPKRPDAHFIADINKTVLFDDSGAKSSIVGVVHDVTDRIKSENRLVAAFNELEASKEKLEQSNLEIRKGIEKAKKLAVAAQSSNKAKSFFLSNISHELRTPLNSIISLTHALLEKTFGPLNPIQTENMEIVSDSARHLQALITDILDLSKIELGKLNLKIARANVVEIAQSSIRMVEQQAALKEVTCKLDNRAAIDLIDADSKRLRQILLNLLVNAVKFTRPKTQITLEIDSPPGSNSIYFTVRDHGIGIQESDFHRIFSPFTQLDDSLARQYEGTGLGLAIVSKLVELHGGGLRVQSRPNEGAQFRVELPCAQHEGAPPGESLPTLAEIALKSKRVDNLVLIVDENDRSTAQALAASRANPQLTTVAAMPNEISAYHDQIAPKAIIVDLSTLSSHGHDWMQISRALPSWKNTHWIATCSLDIATSHESAKQHSFHEFRCKPLKQETFANLIPS